MVRSLHRLKTCLKGVPPRRHAIGSKNQQPSLMTSRACAWGSLGPQTSSFCERTRYAVAEEGTYESHVLDVTYTNDPAIVDAFVETHLRAADRIGFDLEHRPTFRKGQRPNPSLLQFAVYSSTTHVHPVLLYSMHYSTGTLPDSLILVLRSVVGRKVGVGIKSDTKHLAFLELEASQKASFVEIGPMVRDRGFIDVATRGLAACIDATMGPECSLYKTKKVTMSNWEVRDLTPAQRRYAAMDASAGVAVLHHIETHTSPTREDDVRNIGS